jgi:transcriptional regulator with XRE-family HTH domain
MTMVENAFGRRLRELRAGRYSADDLARVLTKNGYPYKGATVTAWERGEITPRTHAVIAELEAILDAAGELGPLLGLASDDPVSRRVAALEDRLAAVEEQLRLLVARRRARRAT